MKRRLLELSVLVGVIAAIVHFTAPSNPLVGTWQGVYERQTVQMEFRADATFVISVAEQVKEGRYSTRPSENGVYHLDLAVDEETVKTIYKFENDDTLIVHDSKPDRPRPTDFEGSTATFHRQE